MSSESIGMQFLRLGRYNIIYADPPWTYRDKALAGRRGACCKYSTMSHQELKNMPIESICTSDCILFLWVTFPKLFESYEILQSWGFEYKTVGFVWIKKNKKADSHFWGMGSWTRSNAEICLLATKGTPKRISAGVHQIVETGGYPVVVERPIEQHSKKPDIVRDKIVELCGDIPRIELFARQKVYGWDAWGDEI